jgi:hypothetical protein
LRIDLISSLNGYSSLICLGFVIEAIDEGMSRSLDESSVLTLLLLLLDRSTT